MQRSPFLPGRILFVSLFVVALIGLPLLIGCSNMKWGKKDEKIPGQIAADAEKGKTMLVGDYTNIGNNHYVEIRGVGLVRGLPDTGADDVNSPQRQYLYDEMLKRGERNVKSLLADPSSAVVEIYGKIPPGCQENDVFDIEIMVPDQSEVRSLRGGWLTRSSMQEMMAFGGNIKEGFALAYAEGPIMVDPLATETNRPANLKRGTILGGARAKDSRKLLLTMKSGYESAFITDRIAKEINHRFYRNGTQKRGIATAKTDVLIELEIHPAYKKDISRYIKVIQSIGCYENQVQQIERMARLKLELLDPAKAQNAAFQLEAIGKPAVETLKSVLNSRNSEVRFHAATSLAFLGDTSASKVLADLARDEPAFRVYALGALRILTNDIESESCLRELLNVSSVETRYGAFNALFQRNPYDRVIRGENLGNQFSYHGVATNGPPFVHVSNSRRPEVVLFGTDIRLKTPFALDAGPFIFVNGNNPGTVIVSKFSGARGVDEKRTVTDKLDSIIRAIVELGGTYPDVVQMLHLAQQSQTLTCRLEVDSLPDYNRVYRRQLNDDELAEKNIVAEKPKPTMMQRMNPTTWFEKNPDGSSSRDGAERNWAPRE